MGTIQAYFELPAASSAQTMGENVYISLGSIHYPSELPTANISWLSTRTTPPPRPPSRPPMPPPNFHHNRPSRSDAERARAERARINYAAYGALLNVARQLHGENIDVVDISWAVLSPETQMGNMISYSATGKVITFEMITGIERALRNAATDVVSELTHGVRIAIVYVTAQDRSTTEYITGELEHILHRQGFFIVDRFELDRIRAEQRFGLSGEVDDNTAARIGHIAGASVVITGRVDGEGNLRRLRLRALDTTSAQVVGTASERL